MKKVTIELPDDCEIQIVKKQVEVKKENEESVIKTYKDMMESECLITGFRINENSEIVPLIGNACGADRNIATIEEIAKSMLAMAMISQLMPYYGGTITDAEWVDTSVEKWCIRRINNKIDKDYTRNVYNFLAFHTAKQRNDFIRNNEELIKNYLMIK